MKKLMSKLPYLVVITCLLIAQPVHVHSQMFDVLKKKAQNLINGNTSGLSFSEKEASEALKEALTNGITKGTNTVSKENGYFSNPTIKIPFPKDAEKVDQTLRKIGLGNKVDEAVLSINRAAEDAAKGALDIFIDAIKQMTINDAIAIVKGDTNAGTQFLRKATTVALTNRYKPIIQNSLDKVEATKHWTTVMNAYNSVPFVSKVNTDLPSYVTDKALEGLFLMIAKEEVAIRKDPLSQASSLLKKVFGGGS